MLESMQVRARQVSRSPELWGRWRRWTGASLLTLAGLLAQPWNSAQAEDVTKPALPKEPPPAVVPAGVPAAPAGEGRPKIRYWLDEPAGQPTTPRPAGPGPSTAPGETVIDERAGRPLVARDEAELDLTAEQRDARRAALSGQIAVKLDECKRAYKAGDYERVLAVSRNILTADPRNIPAMEWLNKANMKLVDADVKLTEIAGQKRDAERMLEVDQHSVAPPPRLKAVRPYLGRREDDPALPKRKKMRERLDEPLEAMDFQNAELEWVFSTLFAISGINVVADPAAIEGKQLTLHVDKLPLRELLDFIVRTNEGISYSVTDDAIWITASEGDDMKKLMFPRIYPLHFGLVSTQAGSGTTGGQRGGGNGRAQGGGTGGGRGGGGGGAQGGGAGASQDQEPSYIETVLKWMKENKDPQVFPDGSDYLVDRQSNQLIVYTTPTGHDKIREFLDAFDQPAIQVLIKTRFLDISGLNEKELGVNIDQITRRVGPFDVNGGNGDPDTGGNTGGNTGGGSVLDPLSETIRNPFHAYAFTGGTGAINIPGSLGAGNILRLIGRRTDPQFQITLAALLNARSTKVLSEPMVLAINNKEAVIDITQHFSYVTDLRPITTSNAVGNGTTTSSVPAFVPEFDEENIGFTLVVTPSVGRDLKTINMHLNPVVDELATGQSIQQFQQFDAAIDASAQQQQSIQRPTINQTSLETDVVMEDNGYVIIGGLMRNFRETRERKVPFLADIPALGKLFRSKSTSIDRRNLMIIVEAQIITPGGRTYYKEPELDDVNPREGGTNRSPGQTSDARNAQGPQAPNRVLDLPDQGQPLPVVRERTQPPSRLPAPASPATPAPAGARTGRTLVDGGRTEELMPGVRVDASKAAEARARMERLARTARMQAAQTGGPQVAPRGWAVPQELELNTAGAAVPLPEAPAQVVPGASENDAPVK